MLEVESFMVSHLGFAVNFAPPRSGKPDEVLLTRSRLERHNWGVEANSDGFAGLPRV